MSSQAAKPKPAKRIGTLQERIVVFFVVLLMVVQLVGFYLIRNEIYDSARSTMRQDLVNGVSVFKKLLAKENRSAVESTRGLTRDYGFREAIATRDRETILSALTNHAARISASGMAVIGLDGMLVTDSLAPKMAGRPFAHAELINEAAALGSTSGIRMYGGKAYQMVVVPVLAPLPIAWVAISFAIDDAMARDLQTLTRADVTFLDVSGAESRLLVSTLPASRQTALRSEMPRIIAAGAEGTTVALGGREFEVLALKLEDSGSTPIVAVVQRPVDEGLLSYFKLQESLLFLAGVSLLITFVGAILIARRVTRPIAQLASAARQIERGNYDVRVSATGSFEINELVSAFDGMTRGLAERDNMRDVLGKVASNAVAEQLLKGEIELGGTELDATVMFTDVRNFTALAEKLTPTQSLQLLNEFLTEISAIIERHEGVVDKYIGDGVMAIFGAPVARPDDTERAVNAALAIRDGVRELGARLAARGMPNPEVGCGLNTSRVIAGNIGSPTRLNYTVLGDGVNLASRLENLTKRYHVPLVAGARTRETVAGFVWRELDKVRVRGRSLADRIYEPLGREGTLAAYDRDLLQRWEGALEHYRARRWNEARAAFESLSVERDYGRLCEIYLGYLRDLESKPPGPDWDGSFTLYEK